MVPLCEHLNSPELGKGLGLDIRTNESKVEAYVPGYRFLSNSDIFWRSGGLFLGSVEVFFS